MLKKNMFVRCPTDPDEKNPRYFSTGKIVSVDEIAETAEVKFADTENISRFYPVPSNTTKPLNRLSHQKLRSGVVVHYRGDNYRVRASKLNDKDGYFYYYLESEQNKIVNACETDINATFNSGYVNPIEQLKNYEFQNPVWFLGRSVVSQTMQTINNSLYGFKDLAGCKIYLKPYQLKTVMRCFKEENCRVMIADEVGLGKTIEAISVLKIFFKDKHNTKALIIAPDALIEQWKIELAFKFKLFEGENENNNFIRLVPFSHLDDEIKETYDFVIADEVHKILCNEALYSKMLSISEKVENIVMLSATPVQKRKNEYQKLLTLIQPDKYRSMSKEEFDSILEIQGKIVRCAHDVMESLDSYREEIEATNNVHTKDTEDVFDDLLDDLEKIKKIINDEKYNYLLNQIDYNNKDFGIEAIQSAISYVCEVYQLEKSIIRNRRSILADDINNIRKLVAIPYDIQTEFNTTEYNIFNELSGWIENLSLTVSEFDAQFKTIVSAFFSSAAAFHTAITANSVGYEIPESLISLSALWVREEKRNIKNIQSYLDDPENVACRMVNIVDYIDQETADEKILLFTNFQETFDVYKKVLVEIFGEESCCFFSKDMEGDELELNAYRFQNSYSHRIMLSDESGGEGRNFQHADMLIHIDIPWNANDIEQRIGRLDRIGREMDNPVVSVVSYAALSLEEDLFNFWNNGLHIFEQSQSGLEIVMNDIDEKITEAVCKDFKYGLGSIIQDTSSMLSDLKKTIKEERYFDLAAYKYQSLNQMLEKSVGLYIKNESEMFSKSMMAWSSLAGFRADNDGENVLRFNANSFSLQSAVNSMFIPPNMKNIIENKLNQLFNRIRIMNKDKVHQFGVNYIRGTFDRYFATNNDYIHFFAPGDDIFDSIVDNAIGSYKGTCTAFSAPADFDWTGFIFTWQLELDWYTLIEQDLSLHSIDAYRGYMPGEQFVVTIPLRGTKHSYDEVIRQYRNIQSKTRKDTVKYVHFGKRDGAKKYIDVFKQTYPLEQWNALVNESYMTAKEKVMDEIKQKCKSQLDLLKKELGDQISAARVTSEFYSTENTAEMKREIAEKIYNLFKNPNIILDSVCYISMVSE